MTNLTAEAVICGAGIAGVAAAEALARAGLRDILIVEQGDPLSMTSDKSTECYRDWWPGPDGAMVGLMSRSIDLLEELAAAADNRIRLNRRGYLYASADPARATEWLRQGRLAEAQGAGPLRVHGRLPGAAPSPEPYRPAAAHGWAGAPAGADLISDPALIRAQFPYLAEDVVAVLHARRCGWLSAQQLGALLLERARAAGATLLRGRLEAVELQGGRVAGARVAAAAGEVTISAPILVDAAGPMAGPVAAMVGAELPIVNQLHLKAAIADAAGVVPREAPMLIWADRAGLGWDEEERAALASDAATSWMTGPLPSGAHCRPEGEGGSSQLLILWDYHSGEVEPRFPPPLDPEFPEIALRGLSRMLPGLRAYLGRMPRAYLDGGYYTRTPENRPLIGPLPAAGAYIIGALSGFGIMAAPAAAELLAAHISGAGLPAYAAAFAPERYGRPEYRAALAAGWDDGQL